MPGTECLHDLGIIPGALVLVVDDETDGGAGGATFEDTGEDLHGVGFAPLGGMTTLPRLAPIQILLQIGLTEFEPGRAAVDDTADGRPVALAETGHRKKPTDAVPGHPQSPPRVICLPAPTRH